MKKAFILLAALAALLFVCTAAAAEETGPVIIDGKYEITFFTADFMDTWGLVQYPGDEESVPEGTHRYALHVFVTEYSGETFESLSQTTFNWLLRDPRGVDYLPSTFTAYETNGQYRDAEIVFAAIGPASGPSEYGPEDMRLIVLRDRGQDTFSLTGVPQDELIQHEVVTPTPTAAPVYAEPLNALTDRVRKDEMKELEVPEDSGEKYKGKIAVAVYESYRPEDDPMVSWDEGTGHFSHWGDYIPEDRLAASLEEADTLVLIWADYTYVGTYGFSSAYRTKTYLSVVDLREDKAYPAILVATEEPPQRIYDRESHYGSFRWVDALQTAADEICPPDDSAAE